MAEAAKQQEEKYKEINWRLYQEQRGKDKPFDWAKMPEPLYVDLFDIEISLSTTLERENEVSLSFSKAKATDEEERLKEVNERVSKELSTEGRKTSVVRALRAKAKFESNRRVNVFENGEISRTWYRTAEFVCREGDGVGCLMHVSGSMLDYDRDHSAPYLAIDTYLPAELFQKIGQQIEGGKAGEVRASLECDVFQSEMERALAESWMMQEYTIEEGSFNFCGLKWIQVGGTKYNPQPQESDQDDEDRAREKALPISADADHQAQAMLLKELQRTNSLLKIIALILAILAIIVFVARH